MSAAQTLREFLDSDGTWFIPACFDALSALLIQQARCPFAFVSGYGVSATRLGAPDVGLITGSEMAETVRYICNAVPGFPLIADADHGYGDAMNVRRTIAEYARAGAAAIVIEDQVIPKRCGHMDDKRVVSREEARMKIRAAVDARRELGLDILILARTDALAPHGFDEALARMRDFEEEGADILFIDAIESEAQMRAFCRAARVPTWLNSFPGGRTPYLSRQVIRDIGFRIVLDPTLLFSATRAMQLHLEAANAGDDARLPPRVSFQQMAALLGLAEHRAISERYVTKD